MAGPLVIGTLVWLIAAVVAGYYVLKEVARQSSELKREANSRIALISIVLVAIQMWMMWITCYMHQMYPLIQPKIEF